MPRQPFVLQNVIYLLEYLVNHGEHAPPDVAFNVKLSLRSDDAADFLLEQVCSPLHADPISMSFRCTVRGVGGMVNLFEASPYTVDSISWKGVHHNEVLVDCIAREVHVVTDSIGFLELCRHKMIGQGVRKFTADLKIQ
jgi:hypothetical protein